MRVAVYVDNSNNVKQVWLLDNDVATSVAIDGYRVRTVSTTSLYDTTGTRITLEVFLKNFDKFTCGDDGIVRQKSSTTLDNRVIATIDTRVPLAFARANTVVDFGRL